MTNSAGTAANASGVEAFWNRGLYGTETEESLTAGDIGIYTLSFVPEAGGNHYVRVDTGAEGDSIDVAGEIVFPVRFSAFDDYR